MNYKVLFESFSGLIILKPCLALPEKCPHYYFNKSDIIGLTFFCFVERKINYYTILQLNTI